jgi:hypothetical protein
MSSRSAITLAFPGMTRSTPAGSDHHRHWIFSQRSTMAGRLSEAIRSDAGFAFLYGINVGAPIVCGGPANRASWTIFGPPAAFLGLHLWARQSRAWWIERPPCGAAPRAAAAGEGNPATRSTGAVLGAAARTSSLGAISD